MADIEHKELPDELLHEPKGASTASAGEVYIADGAGSGSFSKLPTSSLDIVIKNITSVPASDIPETLDVDGSALTGIADGTFSNTSDAALNKNFAEVFRIWQNQKEINEDVKTSINNCISKLNEIIEDLKTWGLADE